MMTLKWKSFQRVSLQWQTSSRLKNSNVEEQQVLGTAPAGHMWQYITSTCDWGQLHIKASTLRLQAPSARSFSTSFRRSTGALFHLNLSPIKKGFCGCHKVSFASNLITSWLRLNRKAVPVLAWHHRCPIIRWKKGWLVSTTGGGQELLSQTFVPSKKLVSKLMASTPLCTTREWGTQCYCHQQSAELFTLSK